MILAPEDAALFYRAWWPLLKWANDQRNVIPRFSTPTPERRMSVALANPIRKVLWAEDSLRERFLSEGAADLGAAERELIGSWTQRVSGRFVALKHLQKHSIFMSKDVFAIIGLYSPLAELIPRVPMFVEATLLPFRDRIIIDGIIESMQIGFGAGARRMLQAQFTEAKAKSQIRTTLRPNPPSPPTSRRKAPAKSRSASNPEQALHGEWRITATEVWDRDALDLVQPAFIRFDDRLGALGMIVVEAGTDCRYRDHDGRPFVVVSFAGDEDGQPCSGRGWATLEVDGKLRGRIFLHQGDDSSFIAERATESAPHRLTRKRRIARRGGG